MSNPGLSRAVGAFQLLYREHLHVQQERMELRSYRGPSGGENAAALQHPFPAAHQHLPQSGTGPEVVVSA